MPLLDKNLAGHGDTRLAVQIFDCTSKKYDLDFSVHIFKQLGIPIVLQLAWFCVNGTFKSTNSQQVDNLTGIK